MINVTNVVTLGLTAWLALVGPSTVLARQVAIPLSLRPYHVVTLSSEARHDHTSDTAAYIFARTDEPRIRLIIDDRQGNLQGMRMIVNGEDQGIVDRHGFGSDDRVFEGFSPDPSVWIGLTTARRGLNHILFEPVYELDDLSREGHLRAAWSGYAHFQRAATVDPISLLRGLRDIHEAEERLYAHLRRFDDLLRHLPLRCFPEDFVRSAPVVTVELRRALSSVRSAPFRAMVRDFQLAAWGRRPDEIALADATIARLEHAQWIWDEPGRQPLAGWLYGTNRDEIYLHDYLRDVELAKRNAKNAYLAIIDPYTPLTEEALDAPEAALRAEVERLTDLLRVIPVVAQAVSRRADEVYARFPWWRTQFRRAFRERVQARIWPGRAYPARDDLFRERVLLEEYFRVMQHLVRADLQAARVRLSVVSSFGRFPTHGSVVPSLSPWHPQDGGR